MSKTYATFENVEELDNFPFESFKDFNDARAKKEVGFTVDRGSALNWSWTDQAPKSLRFKGSFLAFLPILAVLGFIAYAIVTGSWTMLFWLPAIVILFFVFHPSAGLMFGPIRTILVWGTVLGLAYSLFQGPQWLFALTLTLAVIWYAEKSVYQNAVNGLTQAVVTNEKILCLLWQKGLMGVYRPNGDRYWRDSKRENGIDTYYED